ncbi:MAG: ATP-binding cassette domain-containing protein [Planctomycetales bacterium]|nr:ATP-binding cassette domain-containing protein [Planctomycetales bacterium]
MYHLDVCKEIAWDEPMTERAAGLIRMFGVRTYRFVHQRLRHTCRMTLKPGDIVYITGASGAGKTVLLNAIYEQIPADQRLRLDEIPIETGRPLIDFLEKPLFDSMELLRQAGLSDVFCALQQPDRLSEGQRARWRLARALTSGRTVLFADAFTGSLDRIAAAVLAFHLRKTAAQTGKIFVLASCHEDILPELLPDILIVKYLTGRTETLYRDYKRDPSRR